MGELKKQKQTKSCNDEAVQKLDFIFLFNFFDTH